jgi:hypothetical protein
MLPMVREDQSLHVATDEHHLVRAVNFAARRLNEPVYFVLGDPQQLHDLLMQHYPVPAYMADFAEAM